MPHSVLKGLRNREALQHTRAVLDCKKARAESLHIGGQKSIESVHKGGVTWLDLDSVEHRFLLAGAADGSIAAYDVQEGQVHTQKGLAQGVLSEGFTEHRAAFKLDRASPDAHKYSVTCAAWYPIDTGLFVTGSFDQEVKVWDTNALVVACSFAMPVRVFALGMSHVAAVHCLVAVGGGDPQVKLCDPASGAFTHSLVGHREAVWALHWSRSSEWHLFTGACDGQVRLWDIRMSGCVHIFDQHDTRSGTRSGSLRQEANGAQPSRPAAHRTAHEGAVTAVMPTPDGLHCLTAGTDSRLRLWDLHSNSNALVNYPNTFNRAKKGRQIAVSSDAPVVMHPSGSVVQMFELYEGRLLHLLRGHMDTINACCYNPTLQELYTGSNDCQIVVWGARDHAAEADVADDGMDEDNWSD